MDRLCACIQEIRTEITSREAPTGLRSEASGSMQSGAYADNDACPSDTLEDLVRCLSKQIHNSDWLEHNTAKKWAQENPELAQAFMQERSRSDARDQP